MLRPRRMSLFVAITLAACTSGSGFDPNCSSEFGCPVTQAAIQGQVVGTNRQPLDSVRVSVTTLEGSLSLESTSSDTDGRGRYALMLRRLGDPAVTLSLPDTQTVVVHAASLRNFAPDGVTLIARSDTVTIRFAPVRQPAPTDTVNFVLPIP